MSRGRRTKGKGKGAELSGERRGDRRRQDKTRYVQEGKSISYTENEGRGREDEEVYFVRLEESR